MIVEFCSAAGPDPRDRHEGGRQCRGIGAAAVDYLFYSGYVVFAYFLAREAEAVTRASYQGTAEFKAAKLATVRFYFDRILPRTLSHAAGVRAGAESLTGAIDAALAVA
jgi:hypothetical protein